jgi:hypothetical protein
MQTSLRGSYATLHSGLAELLKAYQYAQRAQRDAWDFAVEISRLRALGLTEADFRWLVCMGYAKHAREITRQEDAARQFRPSDNLLLWRRSCFILTEHGESFARSLSDGFGPDGQPRSRLLVEASAARNNGDGAFHAHVPQWDSERHELRVGDKLVKEFRWPAVNQELILGTFQEEGWPQHIDDPLPPQPEQDPKRRLHDTIKCLNRNQRNRLLHFGGDGTGEGVVWEFVADEEIKES